ncbi:MAG TPA: hypothetical protein VE863_16535 [Pyrinomonadaceae bacterium]|nr:hypothetical protein [Pyrinomonadaceae bacterium]
MLLITASAYAQGTIDQYGNFHPTEEQLARNKRMGELLQHPTFISLRLISQKRDRLKEEPSTTPLPYTFGQRIHFELFLTQNSSEDITVMSSWWPYSKYRPELVRDGDLVSYTKETEKLIAGSGKDRWTGSMNISTLAPGHEYLSDYVDLEDWYETPLPVGHYQLTVRKRFTLTGDWVESNPVTFDVVSRS